MGSIGHERVDLVHIEEVLPIVVASRQFSLADPACEGASREPGRFNDFGQGSVVRLLFLRGSHNENLFMRMRECW